MAIITISRGSHSKGKEVAEGVARKLGYQCISRDILLEASKEYNIPEIKLSEAIHDAPSIFKGGRSKERYIAYIRSALLKYFIQDNVVYYGLAGHFFVSGVSHVLKVRILADMADRMRNKMQHEHISREQALNIIKKDDTERRRWSRDLYGIDTWDAALYDLVIHIRHLTTADAAELICQTARLPQFAATATSLATMANLFLAAKIKASLVDILADPDVQVDNSTVVVRAEASPAHQKDLADQITTALRAFPEVTNVSVKFSRLTPYGEDA